MDKIKQTAGLALGAIRRHRKEAITLFSLFLFVVAMGLTCAFNVTKNIQINVDSKEKSAIGAVQTKTVSAALMTPIEEILQNEGVNITDDYTVDTDLSKLAKDVDVVNVTKNVKGTVIADGKSVDFDSTAKTVGDLLDELKLNVDENDEVTPAKNDVLTTDVSQISVARIEVKTEAREDQIPFGVEETVNDQLGTDVQNITTPGVNGLENVVDQVTYRDGQEVARNTLAKVTLKAPVNQVVEVGTKLPGGGNLSTGNRTEDPGSNMDLISAVVAQEGGHTYEGALAVISCMMNRADVGSWGGGDVISVIKAPGQFAAYLDGDYSKYMGAALPEVRQAVTDCMVGGKRSHNYLSFRSYQTSGSVQIAGGNWYFNEK
ncbi:G5 domain-containing protein [Eubacterium barkeri]|uniref:Cell Wall Hydrolase n=1 Tax=Eubacterium barkeri TaxID=1528 RepID=A0A1H3K484_EUBBA|nr:G5 domain-containing protein [Eubacterium barkeri]SDY46408.1 Cell Wall Hydrolase [Eubacterium barkeri]